MPKSDHEGLPGAELVEAGVSDLRGGRESPEALAVAAAATRLRAVGVDVPDAPDGREARPREERPSHRLYDLLAQSDSQGAHGRYNAIMRRLASFARAAENAQTR